MDKILYNWLEQQFYLTNHKKYHRYFTEWVNNITDSQKLYFEKQRINILTDSMIQH